MSRSWKAGVAVADITPPLGVELGGYPYFERGNTGAHDPLVASVLCLEEAGKRLILIATDLFWITRGQADSIRKGVAEETGIRRHHHLLPHAQRPVDERRLRSLR